MLFNINRQKSLALLQLTAAIFILLAPSFLGLLSVSTGIYFMFAVFWALLAVRIKTNGRVCCSIYHIIYLLLAAYSLLSSLWVNNREGQLIYIFALGCVMAFFSVVSEYFAENSGEGIRRRIMYMLSFSGVLCAILNIVHWVLYIVPVAGNSSFKQGLETDNFLAIFMLLCILAAVFLIKGNSGLRKAVVIIEALVMTFVFVMAKSIVGWAFAFLLTAILLLKRKIKSERGFAVFSLGCVTAFLAVIICILASTIHGKAFADVFAYGAKHIFGAGGGFWSGRELFSTVKHTEALGVGLLAYVFAASGILGMLCCICVMARSVMLFLKLKSWESLIGLFICIAVMLLPFGGNFTVILLWLGINAYNEQLAGMTFKLQIKKSNLERTLYTVAVSVIIALVLLTLAIIRMNAASAYKNKNYASAYNLYKTAATINWTDSESCRMAAASIRQLGNIQNQRDEAIRIIDKAIKRDSDNLENIKEKALAYDACGEYELSAQQYRDASQRALIKDKYNLSLAKVLYKIVEKYPKGSSETKRAYEEIVSIAQSTDNLDLRKEINDIADKALGYTKGELSSEG